MLLTAVLLALRREMSDAPLARHVQLSKRIEREAQTELARCEHHVALQRADIALFTFREERLTLLYGDVDLVKCLLQFQVCVVRRQLQFNNQTVHLVDDH